MARTASSKDSHGRFARLGGGTAVPPDKKTKSPDLSVLCAEVDKQVSLRFKVLYLSSGLKHMWEFMCQQSIHRTIRKLWQFLRIHVQKVDIIGLGLHKLNLLDPQENLNTGEIILEELQNKLSAQWKSNLEGLRDLGDKVQDLHASFLFYRNANSEVAKLCTEAYKVLILMIGGTPKSNMFDGWKEFGINLDLHLEDINYIENGLNTMCCTEAVLRVFIQDEEATLDKIANALVKMDRFDILQNLKIFLTELPRLLKNEESNSDVGYISSSWSSNTSGVIIKPVFVANNLPEVLKLADSNQQKDFNSGSTNSFEYSDGINNCSKRNQVLLTFAKSGSYIANHICHTVKNRYPYIDIFTLEDKRQEIQVDTDNYVKRYCTEVDYICPIITEDYLHKISNTQNDEPGDNFDLKYARFIYTLITSRYIHETGCCNVKVRPILPSYADDRTIINVCRHQILTQYIWEDDFQTFLKVCFKNDTE